MNEITNHILVNKAGSIYTVAAVSADFPYNADELALVEMTETMTEQLIMVDPEETNIIDFGSTVYDFDSATWDIKYIAIANVDPTIEKIKELNKNKLIAQQYASIDDFPESVSSIITSHINTLDAINITAENCRDTIIPSLKI